MTFDVVEQPFQLPALHCIYRSCHRLQLSRIRAGNGITIRKPTTASIGSEFKVHDAGNRHALQWPKPSLQSEKVARFGMQDTHVLDTATVREMLAETALCTGIKREVLRVTRIGVCGIPPSRDVLRQRNVNLIRWNRKIEHMLGDKTVGRS